jgi:hypothetical protein
MEKAATKKKQKSKANKKEQYERFQQIARKLSVDDENSAETFERAFAKIVPARLRNAKGS